MKRWLKKIEALGARMWLHEQSTGDWICVLVPADTPKDPILCPPASRGLSRFRDDAIRTAIANYHPSFRTYAAFYAHHEGGRKHPW